MFLFQNKESYLNLIKSHLFKIKKTIDHIIHLYSLYKNRKLNTKTKYFTIHITND